jgi:Golgi apyrase
VSTYGEKPEAVGTEHLKPLLDHALKHVPKSQVKDTPLFLLATAGMRLLPQYQREQVLSNICSFAREHSDFQIPDCGLYIQVIPGETEGLYGWIAANYLLGGFDKPKDHDHGKGHHTYGFLDMGGASAQIAFVPNATEIAKHAEDLKLLRLRKLNGEDDEYRVFSNTWLGFGANQARSRYVDSLKESTSVSVKELPDPCLPSGLKLTTDGKPIPSGVETTQHLLGTGDFPQCLRQTFPLLEKEKPCDDEPCLIGGVHVPSIDFDVNHFVGVSEYWHTTHEIFEASHKHKAYDFHTYQTRVNEFCSQPWADITAGLKKHKWGKDVDEVRAEEVCFKASWLINMLHDGIGIPRIGLENIEDGKNVTKQLLKGAQETGFLKPFQAVNKIEDVEVSWTLGKMVLYASSEVPALEGGYPVGFGTNSPGVAIPLDFQLPSGNKDMLRADDWLDNLFDDSPRRIPGFLLFLLIICVALFLLCGRDRRSAALNRFFSMIGLGRCFGGRKRKGPSYVRVATDGGESGTGFELAAYDSDEEAQGHASGWATPKIVVGGAGDVLGSPGKRPILGDGILARNDSQDKLNAAKRSKSPAIRFGSALSRTTSTT